MTADSRRLVRFPVILLLITATSGCGTFKRAYKVDPVVLDSRPRMDAAGAKIFSPLRQSLRFVFGMPTLDPVWLDEYYFPEATKAEKEGKQTAYKKARETRADRDRLIDKIVARSNDMCVEHMSGYVSQQALNELVLGSATLGLTAATAAVGGTALAAAATAVSGLRSLVSSAIYFEQLTPVLLARALTERDAFYAQIEAKREIFSVERQEPTQPTKPPKSATSPEPATTPEPAKAAGPTNLDECETSERLISLLKDMRSKASKRKEETEQALKAEKDAEKKKVLDKQLERDKEYLKAREASLRDAEQRRYVCRPWDEYSIDTAIIDLQMFHDSCSFYQALGFAERDIRAQKEQIQKNLDKIYNAAKEKAQTSNQKVTGSKDPAATK